MKVLHSDEHKQHVPGDVIDAGAFRPGRDVPDRVDHLLKAAISVGLIPVLVRDHGPGPLAAVHSPEYLDFLAVAYDEWRKLSLVSPKVVPSVSGLIACVTGGDIRSAAQGKPLPSAFAVVSMSGTTP